MTARRLVQMVTQDAAGIAGLDHVLGRLAADRVADLLVLERRGDDPWESVLASGPPEVQLVAIGGDVAYARPDWLAVLLGADAGDQVESVVAWGRPMSVDTALLADGARRAPATARGPARGAHRAIPADRADLGVVAPATTIGP